MVQMIGCDRVLFCHATHLYWLHNTIIIVWRKSKAMEVILMYPACCTGGTVELTRTGNSEKAEIGALHNLEFVVRLSGTMEVWFLVID